MDSGRVKVRLVQLSRRTKRAITILTDMLVVATALSGTLFLVHDQSAGAVINRWILIAVVVAIAVPVFASHGLYRAIIRFVGSRMVFGILRSVSIVAVALAIVAFSMGSDRPAEIFSAVLVFWSFALLGMVGSRFFMRMYLLRQVLPGERVAIYGAGEAGVRLAAALASGKEFVPVAFLDDKMIVQGRSINGLQVYSPESLQKIVAELGVKRVLLALPSVSNRKRREIISNLEALPVHVQTMPDITDLVSGAARVDEIRDVDVADLLGRDSVPPSEKLLDACIRGKAVAVTGAGGSIGSELCRQILLLGPKRLLLLEISEVALYQIERELRKVAQRERLQIEVIGLLGTVHNQARVRNILKAFEIETVYHAAAYKHVPMVEHNMLEGIHNNIFGTWHTARAAEEAGVETFVLISTDKAVSPVNVMGATKRFAELLLQGLHEHGSATRFCMVRFGNVLASSGSVVPLFREQIRSGGPVTVTHPEIIRYFMTIPEAAQLVIQAGSMGRGGDVFVLDMGRPVRIEDLARRMIHLMGLSVRDENNPDGDIAIEYMGLRPAEKLYEELLIGDNVMGTEHPMIMRALEEYLSWEDIGKSLGELEAAISRFDCAGARDVLLEWIIHYKPTNGIEDLVWRAVRGELPAPVSARVTDLDSRRSNAG